MTDLYKMKNRKRIIQYLIAFSVSLVMATVGCIMTWPASVIPKFHNNETDFQITETDVSWIAALTSLGHLVGSLFMKQIADRFGRRITVIGSTLPCVVGTICVVFGKSAWPLFVARFLWGVGGGLITCIVSIYLGELGDKQIRGSLALVTKFMLNFGNFFTMAIGPFVSYSALNFILMLFPISAFLACWWIPESPFYCLKKGKVDRARNVLRRTRTFEDEEALEEELSQMKSQVNNEMRRSGSVKELITEKRYRRALFIAVGLKATQILSGQLVIQHYVGLIVTESKVNVDLATVLVVFGGLKFIFGMLSSAIVDRLGRRPLLIYSYFGTALAFACVGTYFFLLNVILVDPDALEPFHFVPFAGIIVGSVLATLGYYPLADFMPAELFPLNVKTVAIMQLHVWGGLLNFIIARGYQMTKDYIGISGVFAFYTVACFFGAVISLLIVPETKGKSLKEIQIMLQGDLYEEDSKKVAVRNDVIENKEMEYLLKEKIKQENVASTFN